MTVKVKAIFTGGGTGGHIYPALALIKEFKKRRPDSEVLYVGTGGLESKIVPDNKIAFRQISVMGHKRGSFFSAFKEIYSLYRAVKEAKLIIKEFKPDFIMGTGGYVSMPSAIAAKLMGVKVFLHEQNAAPGLSNRFINLFAEKTFISYEAGASRFIRKSSLRLCGNPVRREIIEASSEESYNFFGFDPFKKTILIFGGSIGASSINSAAASLIEDLMSGRDDLQVIFITGERDYNNYKYLQEPKINKNNCLKLFPFLDKIYYAFKISDILICRAGATTLSEIMAGGKCSVLVPYPHATDNHQYKNAMALKEKSAAFIIDDGRLNVSKDLNEIVVRLLEDKNLVEQTGGNALKMAMPEAASLICGEIENSLFINSGEKK